MNIFKHVYNFYNNVFSAEKYHHLYFILQVKLFKVEMVSIGRGRGWAQNDGHSLSKPGKSLYSDDVTYVNLVSLINLVNSENVAQKTEDVVKLINEKVNKENLK